MLLIYSSNILKLISLPIVAVGIYLFWQRNERQHSIIPFRLSTAVVQKETNIRCSSLIYNKDDCTFNTEAFRWCG